MKKVFLSGANDSYESMSILAEALEAEDMQVWRPDRLMPGTATDLTEEILAAIKECDVFVAMLGRAHPNVMFELGYALGIHKSILLLSSGTTRVPFDVASFQLLSVDLFEPASVSRVVDKISKMAPMLNPADLDSSNLEALLMSLIGSDLSWEEITPRQFEELVVTVLQSKEMDAELMPVKNPTGYDVKLIDVPPGKITVVEARKLNPNSRVSIGEVQRVVGSAVTAGAAAAIVVTCGGYTTSAQHFAEESPIRVLLLTIDELLRLSAEEIVQSCE